MVHRLIHVNTKFVSYLLIVLGADAILVHASVAGDVLSLRTDEL